MKIFINERSSLMRLMKKYMSNHFGTIHLKNKKSSEINQ